MQTSALAVALRYAAVTVILWSKPQHEHCEEELSIAVLFVIRRYDNQLPFGGVLSSRSESCAELDGGQPLTLCDTLQVCLIIRLIAVFKQEVHTHIRSR